MFDFDQYDLLRIFGVSVVVIFAASELGRQCGVFARRRGRDNNATLEAAVLGLLALMISFTFAMALTLFETRRDAVLNEANAIGTTALRARLLPAPHDAQAIKLLREYVQIRLDLVQASCFGSRIGRHDRAVQCNSNFPVAGGQGRAGCR